MKKCWRICFFGGYAVFVFLKKRAQKPGGYVDFGGYALATVPHTPVNYKTLIIRLTYDKFRK